MRVDVNLILDRVVERVSADMTTYQKEIDSATNSDEAWKVLVLAELVAVKHIGTAMLTILGKMDFPD